MTKSVTLDTGALIALEQGERKAKILWETLKRDEIDVHVPVAVIVEWWRPGIEFCQKILRAVKIVELTLDNAQTAGTARSKCKEHPPSAVDAIVMLCAYNHNSVVYTDDKGDLSRFLASFPNVKLLSPK